MMKKTLRTLSIVGAQRVRETARDFAKWLDSRGEPQDIFRRLAELTAVVTKQGLQRKLHGHLSDMLDP
jgi:hypothetical protein